MQAAWKTDDQFGRLWTEKQSQSSIQLEKHLIQFYGADSWISMRKLLTSTQTFK